MTDPVPTPDSLLRHAGFLRSLALGLLGEEAAAEDVVQETFVRALQSPPRTRDNLRGWLGKVARNLALMRRRGEGRRHARERASVTRRRGPAPDEVAARLELQTDVARAVHSLVERYRTTVYLRHFEDLKPRDIARRLHIALSTVHTRLQRAYGFLRERLDARHGRKVWTMALAALFLPSKSAAAAAVGVALVSSRIKLSLLAVLLVPSAGMVWHLSQRDTSEPARSTARAAPPVTEPAPEKQGAERSGPEPRHEAFKTKLELLREAAEAGDHNAAKRLVDELSVPSLAGEALLWQILDDGTQNPGFLLSVGVVLGRIGGAQTLERAFERSRDLALAALGYDPKTGMPTPAQAVLNALASNTIRQFMQRDEFRDTAAAQALAFGFDKSVPEFPRGIMLITASSKGGPEILRNIASRFDNAEAVSRRAIISAVCNSGLPDASAYLSEWFTKYPEYRGMVAAGLALNLPAPTALELLRSLGKEEDARGAALNAIRELGRDKNAREFLARAFWAERDLDVRLALLHANAGNGEVVLSSTADPDPEVRGLGYALLPRVAHPSVALPVLARAVSDESKKSAKNGALLGLVSMLGPKRSKHDDVVAVLKREFGACDDAGFARDFVELISRQAQGEGWPADAKAVLKDLASGCKAEHVRRVLRDAAR